MKKFIFPKLLSAALLSTLIATAHVTPVFAAIDESSVANVVSNQLLLQFNVSESTNLIALTWTDGSADPKEISMKKNREKTIDVTVAPTEDLQDSSVTIGVLLEVPTANANQISSLKVADKQVRSFTSLDGSKTYFIIKDGLQVSGDSNAIEQSFNMKFNSTTKQPLDVKIIAVEDNGEGSTTTLAPLASVHYSMDETNLGMMELRVDPLEDLTDGTVVISLPSHIYIDPEFATYFIGESEKSFTEDMLNADGPDRQTITIRNIHTKRDNPIFIRFQTEVSSDPYLFTVQMDADGIGTDKFMSPTTSFYLNGPVPVFTEME